MGKKKQKVKLGFLQVSRCKLTVTKSYSYSNATLCYTACTLKLALTVVPCLYRTQAFTIVAPILEDIDVVFSVGAPSGQSAEFLAPKVDILAYLILSVSLAIVQATLLLVSPSFSNAEGALR
jgi:hypothetical protein